MYIQYRYIAFIRLVPVYIKYVSICVSFHILFIQKWRDKYYRTCLTRFFITASTGFLSFYWIINYLDYLYLSLFWLNLINYKLSHNGYLHHILFQYSYICIYSIKLLEWIVTLASEISLLRTENWALFQDFRDYTPQNLESMYTFMTTF